MESGGRRDRDKMKKGRDERSRRWTRSDRGRLKGKL